ncbi:MAG: hypothetical protein C5B58_06040 [Acidobacteria bacterium]|nr:MAG: hypothetical protein C5B58_06040 [Acidobacteriota bacterium]
MLRIVRTLLGMVGRVLLLGPLILGGAYVTRPYDTSTFMSAIRKHTARYLFPREALPGPIKVAPGSDPLTTVIITADDGDRSWYEILFPILQKYRLPCVQAIIPLLVGEDDKSMFMTWDEVAEIHDWGCEILPHSLTHTRLTTLSIDQARREIVDSRRLLQERLGGKPATVFVTPEGDFNKDVINLIREAGYSAHLKAYGGEIGEVNDASEGFAPVGLLNPYLITRYEVKHYRSAEFMCNVVRKAAGKPELLILVYHGAEHRPAPRSASEYKTMATIGGKLPKEYHVYEDVFDDTMSCIARLREAGDIRVESSVTEAIQFYNGRRIEADRVVAEAGREREGRSAGVQPEKQRRSLVPLPRPDVRKALIAEVKKPE